MNDIKIDSRSGERLSFYQLFEQKYMQVEIPIIQRDYAQGRTEVSEIRDTFLQALHDYLKKGESFQDLDFIYGSVTKNDTGRHRFTPLDGQQRLTTLFLLHWYLAQIAGQQESFRRVLSTDGHSHFTYETRSSSREFCNALVANDIDFCALLLESGTECLSKTIKDRAWFYLSWVSDPTISSMLTMLDAIHLNFSENPDYFDKLIDKDNPVITFRFLNLAEFKLTDDLYIKMNARGKPLTGFENFKARLEKTIKSFTGEWPEYRLSFKDTPASGYEYFIHKIDTDWADLFWCYRNAVTKDDSFDDELMNFFSICIANFLLLQDADGRYSLQKQLFGSGGKISSLSFVDYEQYGYLSQPLIIDLIVRLDLLRGHTNSCTGVAKYMENNRYYDEVAVFKKIILNSSNFSEKLRFHAFYAALANGKRGPELASWMRVVFNLTENTIFNTVDDYHKALLSINELSQRDDTVLNLLIHDVTIKGFLAVQVFEEKLKAHLLIKSSEWKTAILELENHEYFRGQIGFALNFSGIVDYFNCHGNVDWIDAKENYFVRFKHYADSSSAVFSAIGQSSEALGFAWERAVLSKGDYLTPTTADRFNLLSSRTNKNNVDRDHSWRRLLRQESNTSWKTRQQYVKAVLDDPAFDMCDLKAGLEKICIKAVSEQPFNWRTMLIVKPELFSFCNQGFIVKNAHEIVLLHESQRNHYQSELYSRFLALELKDKELNIAPFKQSNYNSVRSGEDISLINLSGFSLDEQQFQVEIFYSDDQYNILFYRNDETALFSDELRSNMESCGFIVLADSKDYNPEDWGCSNDNYVYFCEEPNKALTIISDLCIRLAKLSNE
ncbi:TPA: DUF262 domain-containing protein [Escherichia coli]|uniref:DUF262 domain-containing protein n=1 Tax=Escherichia coli TaxID=562 RepID=UPI001FF3C442|nr:DUF262 domain-containing protein [Escherichia coli]MCU6839869.1 DUF262 domain-containing protein [Escherichia coli]MDD8440339.1 DUF262 domain-containing protein [Escherichia coli]MDD8486156.1 DUF262 domain-containing protein [Escherichia coli]HDP8250507.1 DUF262 domain-containing protein [Escherichia coli]